MPRGGFPWRGSSKGKSQEVNWRDWQDPLCVAEPGWEDEPKKVWDCTTCKKYVKMTHLCKMWEQDRVELQVRRWEGQMSSCKSAHFVQRYEEIWAASNLPGSKPNVMNYSNMAMIWAEIVLQKEVDWRTLAGRNVANLNRHHTMIDTNWTGPSDCMPEWSNRGQFGIPAVVLPDAEDDDSDEDDEEDVPTPMATTERHERREAREDIEYEQQMREAMRRSLEDRGRHHGHHASYPRDHGAQAPQHRGGNSQHGNDPQGGSESRGGSHGSTQYGGSSHGGSQHYPGPHDYSGCTGHGSYGHPRGSQYYPGPPSYPGSSAHDSYGHPGGSYYGGSMGGGSQHNVPAPPPTFGGPYYGNYGQGGAASGGYGYNDGRGPYGGSGSRNPSKKEDSSSDSE